MKYLFMLVTSSALWLMACKKESISSEKPIAISEQSKIQLKSWVESHSHFRSSSTSRDPSDSFALPEQRMIWDSAKFYPADLVYTIPIAKSTVSDPNTLRSLVVKQDANGNIISGEFTFIKLTNAPANLTPQQVLATYPKVFDFYDMPMNFTATMLKFDLEGNITFSKHYQNNMITDATEKIKSVYKAPVAQNPEGGFEICVDSWWVTYEYGEVISIEWLWSDCWVTGGSPGGGGGGSSPTTCYETVEAAQSAADDVTVEETYDHTSTLGSMYPDDGEVGAFLKDKFYNWMFLTLNYGFGYSSMWSAHFIGTISQKNGQPWKWKTISYANSDQSGGSFPPCISSTVNALGICSVNSDGTATASIQYTATTSASCAFGVQIGTPMTGTLTDPEIGALE